MASIRESLAYQPAELRFGTSGLRDLVSDMTDLECYINTAGFLGFLLAQGIPKGPVLIAGDLRESTPRIIGAVVKAASDKGFTPEYHGFIPTPALAYHALQRGVPCIMVTGSHIPADRNGIKFYKPDGEVLKGDEAAIKAAVAAERQVFYAQAAAESLFGAQGMFKAPQELPETEDGAYQAYRERYLDVFPPDCLTGKKIVFYQHSAVGRDLLTGILEDLGAAVVAVGRSDVFIPIDSDNVTTKDRAYFHQLSQEHSDTFAIISIDGDSDRPFMVDETGEFHYGDVLGAVVAEWCKADFAVTVAAASDAVDTELERQHIRTKRTRIGSPYVIQGMLDAKAEGAKRVVGWELNGGFLLGTDLALPHGTLKPLVTRDAFFPILACLQAAAEHGIKVSEVFSHLPQRFTGTGLIDNFPAEISKAIVAHFSSNDPNINTELEQYFTPGRGFGKITTINTTDGVRITFDNGDIAHLRPSGNAPQLRIYSIADTQVRADEIVAMAIAEPDGIFRTIEKSLE